MKECPICKGFPVIKGTGFCKRHHNAYIKALRSFKRKFVFNHRYVEHLTKSLKEKT